MVRSLVPGCSLAVMSPARTTTVAARCKKSWLQTLVSFKVLGRSLFPPLYSVNAGGGTHGTLELCGTGCCRPGAGQS